MKVYFFLLLSCTVLFFSCVQESKEDTLSIENVLPGYWELINATRNGKAVPSLEGTYFEFDTLGNISTNFSGNQVVADFEIVENSILYKESNKSNKLDFTIKGPDTLNFSTVMRKIFNFELTLLRVEKESN